MSFVKSTKKFLNELIHNSINKISGGAFQNILKSATGSRDEYLEAYKIQLPEILKNHSSKNKLTVKSFKDEFKAPGVDYKENYFISGYIPYEFTNKNKKTGIMELKIQQKFFNIPVKNMTRKMINKPGFVEGLADEYLKIDENYDDNVRALPLQKYTLTPVVKTNMITHPMGHKKHSIKALENADAVNVHEGECAIDYIMYELAGKPFFKSLTREKIISFFGGLTATPEQMIAFAKQYDNLSVYAIDPLRNVFASHKSHSNCNSHSLCFIVNNNHLYPILDSNMKKSIAQTGKITLNEYKFNISYDDYQYIHDRDEIDITKKVVLFREFTENNNVFTIQEKMKNSMERIDEKTGKKYVVDQIKFQNGKITAFQDPITNQIIESTSDFNERKLIVDGLSQKYGNHLVKFQNQSYTQISKIIFDNEFGTVKQLQSNLSEKIFDILDKNHIKPFCATLSKDFEQGEDGHGYDVCKSYSSVLLSNDVPFPIFQQFDEVQQFTKDSEFVAGEYYISKAMKFCNGMIYPRGWYPFNLVKFARSRKCITRSDITMYIPAKQFIQPDVFKSFVEYVYTSFDEIDSKKIINFFIGDLGQKFTKSDSGCITSSFDIACALLLQYEKTHHVSIDSLNDYHFVRVQSQVKKYKTALPIHRHIIAGGIINLVKLHDDIVEFETKTEIIDDEEFVTLPSIVIAFNTDSIMIRNPKITDEFYDNRMVKSAQSVLSSIGKVRTEDWKIKCLSVSFFINNEIEEYKPNQWSVLVEGENFAEFCKTVDGIGSAVICGGPGCGKTEVIKTIKNDSDLVLSFTNKAVENVISRCGNEDNCYTFDSFLNDHLDYEQKVQKMLKYERVIIDEYSMVPVKFMEFLNQMKSRFNIKLLFFGDANQCLQVDSNKIIYDYITTSTFLKMCDGNQFVCSYKEQFSRYDMALKTELDYFLENGKIQPTLSDKKEQLTYSNICRSLAKKWKVIEACSKRFRAEHPTNKTLKLSFTKDIRGKQQKIDYTYAVGEKIMCIENIKELKLYNGTICEINDIIDGKFIVGEFTFEQSKFITSFESNFAQTIYKYQGATIGELYTIHELNIMTKRELYTSMSRGKKLSDVNFTYSEKQFVNEDVCKGHQIAIKIDNEIDEKYMNGKIYKIRFDNDIYIGSTIKEIKERFDEHQSAKKGSDFIEALKKSKTAKIELVKLYPCVSKNELVAEELKILDEYIASGEFRVLNTIGNRKKAVINSEVNIERLEKINLEEISEYHIVENVKTNIIRLQAVINSKKVDIRVSLNNKTKEEAVAVIQLKLEAMIVPTTSTSIKSRVGKILLTWD